MTGLPIILLPASFQEPLWILIRPLFAWVQYLPFGLGSWYLYTDLGWPMIDRTRTHLKLGDTFILVSPSINHIVTAYPPAAEYIYQKYRTWIKPPAMTEIFNVYGPHVVSTNGQDWQRHRKITAPAFNDQNFRYVWTESVRQCQAWLKVNDEKRKGTATISDIREDVSILAMHVLAAVGFGSQVDFAAGVQQRPPGHQLTLMEALDFILQNVIMTLLFSGLKAPTALLPSHLKRLKLCVQEFKLYMEEAVLRQMKVANSSSSSSNNNNNNNNNNSNSAKTLVGALVKANEEEKRQHQHQHHQQKQTPISRPTYLTDEELYGNLFIFNLAGFETTAGTMTFALPFLAAYPEIQAWVREEVDVHFVDGEGSQRTSYDDTFPRMTRCLAVMYETLRLAGPASQMVRWATDPQSLPIGPDNKTLEIPPYTFVSAQFYHLHLNPRTWGTDAAVFDPKRFVSLDETTGEETIAPPPRHAGYIAWLTGPRVCPGKRFSQVEFVAVVGSILSRYRVEPGGGSRENLLRVIDDFYFNVSAHVRRPAEAAVRFVRRKEKVPSL